MIPTTLSKPATIPATLPVRTTDRATLPLRFTIFRECLNEEIMAAIIDALSDKSRSDQCLAAIFKNACLHRYQIELNKIIKNIEKRHGAGTVIVNDNIIDILALDQIKLVQNSDGTVELEKTNPVHQDPDRHDMINSTLGHILPAALCNLIGSYDDEFEICEKNKVDIKNYLIYGKPAEKRLILVAARHQNRMPLLNEMLRELNKIRKFCVNFSYMDLSNLNLTGIDLAWSNLTGANLQDTCLVNAVLVGANLRCAKLNNANLAQAVISSANLDRARLIGANLSGATLLNTTGTFACLFCANLQGVGSNILRNFGGAAFNFSKFKMSNDEFYNPDNLTPIDAPVNVKILPAITDRTKPVISDEKLPGMKIFVIDENEKSILLSKGMAFHDQSDGTVQLHRPLTLRHDPQRNRVIDSTLKFLPKVLTELISDYDDEIEISEANEAAILNILKSGDPVAKGQIIAAASIQSRIPFLNLLFQKLWNPRIRLDLAHVDISNLNLAGINLNGANLRHTVMQDCNLSCASLQRADLSHANLTGAIFEYAQFHNANMTDAQLIGANLSRTIMFNTTLVRANLKCANLELAELRGGADLTEAFLDYANLDRADLFGAVMVNTTLIHASMHLSILRETNLTRAKLMHVRITHANLMSVNLSHADLSGATVENVNLRHRPILKGTIWNEVRAKHISADLNTRARLPLRIALRCI